MVGSILNFTLLYLLAHTMSSTLPAILAGCPNSYMFEEAVRSEGRERLRREGRDGAGGQEGVTEKGEGRLEKTMSCHHL